MFFPFRRANIFFEKHPGAFGYPHSLWPRQSELFPLSLNFPGKPVPLQCIGYKKICSPDPLHSTELTAISLLTYSCCFKFKYAFYFLENTPKTWSIRPWLPSTESLQSRVKCVPLSTCTWKNVFPDKPLTANMIPHIWKGSHEGLSRHKTLSSPTQASPTPTCWQ